MNKFIIEELVNFASGILVETSFILALDRTLGYTAIYPYHIEGGEKMDYIRAAYFVIISFSTIGYGDIFPVDRIARLVMCFLLVINITVMSSFLGNLIAQIFSLSPYNREYDFKDHVIIIGYID